MPPRPTFDAVFVASRRQNIATTRNRRRLWQPKRHVMQSWAITIGQRHIMYAGLTIHPRRPQTHLGRVSHRIFRAAKAKLAVIFIPRRHIWHMQIKMIDTQNMWPAISMKLLHHPFNIAHVIIKLGVKPQRVAHAQGATLPGLDSIDPLCLATQCHKMCRQHI